MEPLWITIFILAMGYSGYKLSNLFAAKQKAKERETLKDEIITTWLVNDQVWFKADLAHPEKKYLTTRSGQYKVLHPNGVLCQVEYPYLTPSLVVIPFNNIDENTSLRWKREREEEAQRAIEHAKEQEILKMYIDVAKDGKI